MKAGKFGKKQLVMASLVLALGAAVYLNWQFTGANKLPVGERQEESAESQLGAAQLVNSAYVETVSDDLEQRAPSAARQTAADPFSEARVSRQSSRDAAMELLEQVLQSTESDATAKEAAVEQAAVIAQSILQETSVENLLKAKGYAETVAYLADGECSVVVSGQLQEADALIIQEIVMEQTGCTADKIKIIGTD